MIYIKDMGKSLRMLKRYNLYQGYEKIFKNFNEDNSKSIIEH